MSAPAPAGETAAVEAFRARGYFENLDGLRGLSILLVLVHHAPDFASPLWRAVRGNAALGVPVFFAISGFLITALLLREERARGAIALGKFYGRRAVRLLPVYYAVLLVYAWLVWGSGLVHGEARALFDERWWSYVFYYSNFVLPIEGPYSHAWSLAVEEQFYLVFGCAMVFLPRKLLVALTALLAVLTTLPLGQYVGAGQPYVRAFAHLPPSLVHGVAIAFALDTWRGFAAAQQLARPAVVWSALALGSGLLAIPDVRSRPWILALFLLAVVVLITSAVLQERLTLLGGQALSYIGKISYGIYLQHALCRHAFEKVTGIEEPWIVLLGMTALTLPLAHLSYRYFEQPLIRRFAPRLAALPRPARA